MKIIILFALLSCSINNYCISQEMENIPLTIDSMFKIAEENNRAIKLQKLLEEISREGISVSKNALLPSIDFSL
jgi:outer membrane protein TolC